MAKHRHGDYWHRSWYAREYAGVPGWLLVVLALVLIGLAIVIAYFIANPR